MTGFQSAINVNPAPGKPGDFASNNPRASVLSGPGGLIAGTDGVTVGRFAWIDPFTKEVVQHGAGAPIGFVANELQASITTWLAESSELIQAGRPVSLYNRGDLWAKSSTQGIRGQKVYANLATGALSTAATGSPTSSGSGSASSVAANATLSFTGVIARTTQPSGDEGVPVLTASAVTGTIVPGALLSGTGVVTGTRIVKQLSGTTGGAGTYEVSIAQDVASTTITGAHGVLTVGGTVTGSFGVGAVISGTGVDAGTVITALGTGTGGSGTYIVDSATVVTSTAIAATGNVETDFYVESNGAANELIKISTRG